MRRGCWLLGGLEVVGIGLAVWGVCRAGWIPIACAVAAVVVCVLHAVMNPRREEEDG